MTEQTAAQRNDNELVEEDDPLAELARIISGESTPEPTNQPASQAAEPDFDFDTAFAAELEAEVHAEQAIEQPHPHQPVEQPDMRSSVVEPHTPNAPAAVEPIESASGQAQAPSLEDQLLAELDATDLTPGQDTPSAAEPPVAEPVQQPPQPAPSDTKPMGRATPYLVSDDAPQTQQNSDAAGEMDDPISRLEAVANSFHDTHVQNGAESGIDNDGELDRFFEAAIEEDFAQTGAQSTQSGIHQVAAEEDALIDSLAEGMAAELDAEMAAMPEGDAALDRQPIDFAAAFSEEINLGARNEAQPASASDIHAEVAAPAVDYAQAPQAYSQDDPQPEHPATDPAAAAVPFAPPAKRAGGFRLALGALAIALVVGGGVVAWGTLSGPTNVADADAPVIRADGEPAKVKPEDPGGTVIANQDNQVYNRVAGNEDSQASQDTLITSRQEPVDVPEKADARLAPDAADPAVPAAGQTLGLEPKRVRTLVVKPDGTILRNEASADAEPTQTAALETPTEPAAPEATAAPQSTAAEPQVAATQSDDAASAAVAIDGARSTGRLAIPQPSPRQPEPAPATPAPSTPAPATAAPAPQPAPQPAAPAQTAAVEETASASSAAPAQSAAVTQDTSAVADAWKVQVSSQRSVEAAEQSFRNIQRRFASILGGRQALIKPADIEGRGTFYRAQVITSSQQEATQICDRLKNAGGSCFVTR